jgi:hypothetical protein
MKTVTHEKVALIAAEQGWDSHTLSELALDFIREEHLDQKFVDFLHDVANTENEKSEDEEQTCEEEGCDEPVYIERFCFEHHAEECPSRRSWTGGMREMGADACMCFAYGKPEKDA